jgi:hypothetical protein
MRMIIGRLLVCVCWSALAVSLIVGVPRGESCKTSLPPICEGGGTHYVAAGVWLAVGVAALVGARALRKDRSTRRSA